MSEVAAALAPHLLWASVLAVGLWRVGGISVRDVLSRVKGVEFSGVRIDIESAVESAAVAQNVTVSRRASRAVAERLRRSQGRVAATRLLWIDDEPNGNKAEMKLLKGLGATIDLAHSSKDARERLAAAIYDIVLSDIKRGERDDEGVRFLPEVSAALLEPPVIFYVTESKGTPEGAFGIATRPDELMHLIVDALDRRGS